MSNEIQSANQVSNPKPVLYIAVSKKGEFRGAYLDNGVNDGTEFKTPTEDTFRIYAEDIYDSSSIQRGFKCYSSEIFNKYAMYEALEGINNFIKKNNTEIVFVRDIEGLNLSDKRSQVILARPDADEYENNNLKQKFCEKNNLNKSGENIFTQYFDNLSTKIKLKSQGEELAIDIVEKILQDGKLDKNELINICSFINNNALDIKFEASKDKEGSLVEFPIQQILDGLISDNIKVTVTDPATDRAFYASYYKNVEGNTEIKKGPVRE